MRVISAKAGFFNAAKGWDFMQKLATLRFRIIKINVTTLKQMIRTL